MEAVAAPVVVRELKPERVEVLDIYSGMIHPFERYSVGFEVPGRIERAGENTRWSGPGRRRSRDARAEFWQGSTTELHQARSKK